MLDEAGCFNNDGILASVIAYKNRNLEIAKLLAPIEKLVRNREGKYPYEQLLSIWC